MATTYRWKKLRTKLIDERPWVCALCDLPITTRAEIDLDHRYPLAADPDGRDDPYDPDLLQLTHRSCNRRKGAGRTPKDWRDLPPWMVPDSEKQRR